MENCAPVLWQMVQLSPNLGSVWDSAWTATGMSAWHPVQAPVMAFTGLMGPWGSRIWFLPRGRLASLPPVWQTEQLRVSPAEPVEDIAG